MVSFNHTNGENIVHGIYSHPFTLLMENKINPLLNKCLRFINTQIEERYFNKSALSLDKVLNLNLKMFKVKDYRCSLFRELVQIIRLISLKNHRNSSQNRRIRKELIQRFLGNFSANIRELLAISRLNFWQIYGNFPVFFRRF
jgi:hypothetical protein